MRAPGIRTVLTTGDIFPTPFSNGLLYTTQRFHDANPRLFAVLMAALDEAARRIAADKGAAAALYARATQAKAPVEEIRRALDAPGVEYGLVPHNVLEIARFMHRVGTIRRDPASWRDLFFPEAHALPGS